MTGTSDRLWRFRWEAPQTSTTADGQLLNKWMKLFLESCPLGEDTWSTISTGSVFIIRNGTQAIDPPDLPWRRRVAEIGAYKAAKHKAVEVGFTLQRFQDIPREGA